MQHHMNLIDITGRKLKMVTEKECEKALEHIKTLRGSNYGWYYSGFNNSALPFDEDINVVQELMHEHFDNPPLKFEELKEGMWIWDNKDKAYMKIESVCDKDWVWLYIDSSEREHIDELYEPNRFYRKEVHK